MSRGRESVSHSRDGVSVRRSQSVAQDMTSGAREEETALRMRCSSARRRRLDEQDAMGVRVVRGRKREGTDEDVDERKQNRNGSRIRRLKGRHVEEQMDVTQKETSSLRKRGHYTSLHGTPLTFSMICWIFLLITKNRKHSKK